MSAPPRIDWNEDGVAREARWLSGSGEPPPGRVLVVDDRLTADEAYGRACQGTALLWRGDFQNARQMLAALALRIDRRMRASRDDGTDSDGGRRRARRANRHRPGGESASALHAPVTLAAAFHRERQARAQRARTLGRLLIELGDDYSIALRRAPEVQAACTAAFGAAAGPAVLSLRALQGAIGAHEWRRRGIEVPAAGGRIHPHYGVFAPVRSEYVELVAQAPLPAALASVDLAFDVGTGTGVLAAVLARRGIGRVIATDRDERALACARENLERLGLASRVEVLRADLFPPGRAALVVCNPPWLPARPSSPLEHAVYDPESRMLLGFLRGLAAHLAPGGEGWLIFSDLAEHLGLRSRAELLAAFDAAGLQVQGRLDARPVHPRVADATDALHAARQAEVTSIWRLRAG